MVIFFIRSKQFLILFLYPDKRFVKPYVHILHAMNNPERFIENTLSLQ